MTVIYPGSFDPVTMGHMDIARRAAKFAGRLIVAVLDNPHKETLFSVEERISFLRDAFSHEKLINVEIDSFSGLLGDYAKQKGANAILRGLRTPSDFEHEYKYAICNSCLSEETETIFLPASPAFIHVSSTIIKEVAAHGAERFNLSFLSEYLPPSARAALKSRLG